MLTGLPDEPPRPAANGTTPVVTQDARGRYVVSWPAGRGASVELSADLFERMVSDLNDGRVAMTALQAISQALTNVVPSA